MDSPLLTPRAAFALVALACALLLGFGFYLQYGRGLEPCPLCLVQRAFFFAMMENFPLSRTLKTLFSGTGECAVVDWTFLRLSIAEWSLVSFVGLFAFAVW